MMPEKSTAGFTNQPGRDWEHFYKGGEPLWLDPAQVDLAHLDRLKDSEWITRLLRYANFEEGSNRKILEAGCGTGVFSAVLSLLGFQVQALDYNEEALKMARRIRAKAEEERKPLPLECLRGDILHLPFRTGSFDLVFNQAVMEYFCNADERRRALQEMVRVLRPGGRLVVITQHTLHPFRKVWKKLGWPGYVHQPPVISWKAAHLQRELRELGLQNIVCDGIYPWKSFFFWPPWYKKWKWSNEGVYLLQRFLERLIPVPKFWRVYLSTQFVIGGMKP